MFHVSVVLCSLFGHIEADQYSQSDVLLVVNVTTDQKDCSKVKWTIEKDIVERRIGTHIVSLTTHRAWDCGCVLDASDCYPKAVKAKQCVMYPMHDISDKLVTHLYFVSSSSSSSSSSSLRSLRSSSSSSASLRSTVYTVTPPHQWRTHASSVLLSRRTTVSIVHSGHTFHLSD